MKKIITIIISVIFCQGVFAQSYEILVKESSESFASGGHNALYVTIFECDAKDIEKQWKKLMKDYKGKVSSKDNIFADDVLIKEMSTNTCDVYAFVKAGTDGDQQLVVGVDLGGAYLSSSQHPNMFTAFSKVLYTFGVEATKEAIRGQQKEAEKVLKTLEKDKETLINNNEDLHKAIEDYKQKIVQAEADIEKNVADQEAKTVEISDQQKVIEQIIAKEQAVK